MTQFNINFINNRRALADGDEVRLTASNQAKFLIASTSTELTVAIKMLDGGAFRAFDKTIPAGQALVTDLLPNGTILKITGGASEVWAYGT